MTMPTYQTILVDKEDGITTITFNRPEKRNAMSPALHRDMWDALNRLEDDEETRVLVITGTGDSFCAGQDLKEYFYDLQDTKKARPVRAVANDWRGFKLRLFPKPTIASINGWCFGGAFTIVASCDLALASETATFGLSEINFAAFPGGLVSKVVGELLRPRDAMYYIMTGDSFDGKRAEEIGFVNKAVPAGKLKEETRSLAQKLLDKDPIALSIAKEVFKMSLDMNYEQALRYSHAAGHARTYMQKGLSIEKGIGDFLKGKYRPGLGAVKLEQP